MSVIIKGAKLPEKSEHREYTIGIEQDCPAAIMLLRTKTKPSEFFKCAEIPTPHGRLIDADKLLESFGEAIEEDNHFVDFFSLVDKAPTIIEAEVSEEDEFE